THAAGEGKGQDHPTNLRHSVLPVACRSDAVSDPATARRAKQPRCHAPGSHACRSSSSPLHASCRSNLATHQMADRFPVGSWAALTRGDPLEAVVEAVALLEDDPHFNAGMGSVLTEDGLIEMDASAMRGDMLAAGAVAVVTGVGNPIRLARAVLREGREVLLVGEAAVALAERHGVRRCAPEALVTEESRRRWRERAPASGETVGAVACDGRGQVAAATSTGGVAGKRRGRVGDSAVIGAGTYADDRLGAGSATGPGEAIIRLGLTRAAPELVARRHAP